MSRTKPGAVTVKEVALRAGVHPSTVSRALNLGTRRVSSDLVERVLAAAKELGYRPNGMARALRLERSSSIGMLIPDISNPIYAPIVRGAEDALRSQGLSVLVASTDNDEAREADLLDIMLDRKVDAILLATATRDSRQLPRLIDAGIPVTLIGRSTDTAWAPVVRADDELGIRLAVDHLRNLGHRHIAHLAGTDSVSSGHDRRRALVRALEEMKLPIDPDAIISADLFDAPVSVELGTMMAQELLRRSVPFTGLVAANDLLALGSYDVFSKAGIAVPSDVSIVGFNDIFLVDRLMPPLTTIKLPFYEIGARAGRLALEQLAGLPTEALVVSLRPRLVQRGSTGPASASRAT